MQLLGLILGFFLGSLVLGPLGALLGAFLGYHFILVLKQQSFSQPSTNDSLILVRTLFTTLGYLNKLKGRVTEQDIQIAEQRMYELQLNDSACVLSSYSARKLGLQTTGHAGGLHHWQVSHQTADLATLLKQMQRGLLVTELMGQGVNIVTGDYSRGAAGFWVEGGEIQYPVYEITIAGNLLTLFKEIVAIGSDLETRSSIQTGPVLISSMQIAGS